MAVLSAAQINDLPDSDFLYIEPGGTKDADGKTTPRSKRHFPVPDVEHVRNALARIPQSNLPADVKAAATAKARAMLARMTKDFDMDEDELELDGSTGWKSSPAVADLDGEKEGDLVVAFADADGTTIDRDGHITDPGAFPSKRVPVSAYGHTSWPDKGARLPVGVTNIDEENRKAIARGRFLLDTTDGLNTYRTVKALGDLQEWSYGYRILAHAKAAAAEGKKRLLRLTKLDVHEISPVLVGAGLGTRTLSLKSDEDGPLAGLPYAEHLDRVLVLVGGIVDRSKSLRELRAKDGRELSEANRSRIVALRDRILALEESKAELEELLSRTDRSEPDAKAAGLALFMEFERTKAGLAGVLTGG